MSKDLQRRTLGVSRMEVRAVDGAPTKLVGYASVFNSVANREVIRPGAFKKTLMEGGDFKAYWNHNSDMILGRKSNGTLVLREDGKGLYCEITPNQETSWGRDAMAAAARGDVRGMSFGFYVIKQNVIEIGGESVTEILEVRLIEVSPCGDPWYPETEIEARKKNPQMTGRRTKTARRIIEAFTLKLQTLASRDQRPT